MSHSRLLSVMGEVEWGRKERGRRRGEEGEGEGEREKEREKKEEGERSKVGRDIGILLANKPCTVYQVRRFTCSRTICINNNCIGHCLVSIRKWAWVRG